ncbi:hypothetical protein AAE045_18815, partial [Dryocola clanedunensis]
SGYLLPFNRPQAVIPSGATHSQKRILLTTRRLINGEQAIAAVAILVTNNVREFARMPGLVQKDRVR